MKPTLKDSDRAALQECLERVTKAHEAFQAAERKVEDLNKALDQAPNALKRESEMFEDGDDAAAKRIADLKIAIETLPHRIPVAERAQDDAKTKLIQACNQARGQVEKVMVPRLQRLELVVAEYLGRVWFNGWATPQVRQTDLFRMAVHFKVCHWNDEANNINSRANGAAAALRTLLEERDHWLNLETVEA